MKGSIMKKTALTLAMAMLLCGTIAHGAINAYAEQNSPNEAPSVIPAVREWNGGQGKIVFDGEISVVLDDDSLLTPARKEIISDYFTDIVGKTPVFKSGTANGTIRLHKATENALDGISKERIDALGSEGYILRANGTIDIYALDSKGLLYGIITVLQSYVADGYMPNGEIYDVPSYPIRSGMLDVARAYVPLDYVEEITKYFAWFKLNEIHLHINDRGSDGKGYFRLESDIPNLTSKEHYSKADYRAYQKRMLEYGVEVVTEIDTPAHSSCFASAVPQYMFDENHIDINNPEAIQFICDLWDEYILGDDPVFVSKTVHFGTDEFPEGYNEQMRAYTDALIKHLRSRGCTPRFWGSFGNDGFNGNTPVSGDAQTNFWAVSLSDYRTLFDMGYDVINTCGPVLYCVPGGNYGFADYYDLKRLYASWFVNYMGYNEATSVKYDHPQLKGACFALWNDLWCDWGGFSVFDIFDRVRYQVCLISEKAWCGEQTRSIDADDFVQRFNTLSLTTGGSNPGRHEELPITLDNVSGIKSIGYPYLMTATINVPEYDTDLFSGSDGRLYVNKTGKLCFARESYTFTYDYVVPTDTDVKIQLYADRNRTLLIVNDTWYYSPSNSRTTRTDVKGGSTFVLPLENISSCVKSLEITEHTFNPNDYLLNSNLALGKKVTVSGLEVNYGLNEPMAVDGDMNTRLSFARDKDEQWMIVDLGAVKEVNEVRIHFFETVPAFEVYVSENGESYEKVWEESGIGEGLRGQSFTGSFDTVNARYIKYVQLKRWFCADYSTYYSGGISEFEVFSPVPEHSELLEEANQYISDKEVSKAYNAIERYLRKPEQYKSHLEGLYNELAVAVNNAKNPVSEEPSEEISEPTVSSINSQSHDVDEKDSGSPIVPIAIGAGVVAAVAAVAAIIFKKRKK